MKTKNIFKALALAMLMPAMLLTTACSNDDNLVNNETTNQKGYPLPVTVNVTRQGDNATTRTTYNATDKKLEFSAGDKLFVNGSLGKAGQFAGVLNMGAVGTFSGTIYTQNSYSGTADELLSVGRATLLPAGYNTYNFLSIEREGTYYAYPNSGLDKAFTTVSKAKAVEQFSLEQGGYNAVNGFVLKPHKAILNFTITGLTPNTEYAVVVIANDYNIGEYVIGGNVTTDGSGNATFAVGISNISSSELKLTVGGNAVALNLGGADGGSNVELVAGHIYNINRSAAPAPAAKAAAEATAGDLGKVIGADGKIYTDAAAATAASTTAVALITYVGSDNGESAPYNHGLALALTDANNGNTCMWRTTNTDAGHTRQTDKTNFTSESGLQYNNATHNSDTYPAFKAAIANNGTAAPTGCSAWFLASCYQWAKMFTAAGGYANLKTNAGLVSSKWYWPSSEKSQSLVWCFDSDDGIWYETTRNDTEDLLVRACLAF